MSFASGMAAFNLEMQDRVPRMELSAAQHWKLIENVCGIKVNESSSPEEQQIASSAFIKAWDYAYNWNVVITSWVFGDKKTSMGHAVYAQGGVDRDDHIGSAFEDEDDVLKFDPYAAYNFNKPFIKQLFIDDYNKQRTLYPDCVGMTGTYVTCISGLIDMFGWDLLLTAAGIDSDGFGEVTNRYARYMQQYFDTLAETDIPVIMVHDDIVWTEGAFLPPEWYRKYVFPHYKKYFAPILESGKRLIFTSDGNYTEFIDDIAACGVHGFVMEPCTDMQYIADKYGKTHSFTGNADTRVLLSGSKEDIYAEVKRCMDIGKKYPGYILNVGNHIPANTPVDACLYYNEAYLDLSRR